jgi:hypothetical protein
MVRPSIRREWIGKLRQAAFARVRAVETRKAQLRWAA